MSPDNDVPPDAGPGLNSGMLAVIAVGLVMLVAFISTNSSPYGLDGTLRLDQLTAEQRSQVCTGWLADMGGGGLSMECAIGEGTTVGYTTPTHAQCLEDPLFATECTVSALGSCYEVTGTCGQGAGDCAALESCAVLPPANDLIMLDNDNYDREVLESDKPVLVFVTSSLEWSGIWCLPCKQMYPQIFDKRYVFNGPGVDDWTEKPSLAVEYADRVKFTVLSIDDQPSLSIRLGLRIIPQLMFMKDGAKVDGMKAVRSSYEIKSFIDKNLDG